MHSAATVPPWQHQRLLPSSPSSSASSSIFTPPPPWQRWRLLASLLLYPLLLLHFVPPRPSSLSLSHLCVLLLLLHLHLLLLALFSFAITVFLGSPSFLLSPFNPHRVRAFSNATVSMYTHTQCESLSSMYNAHTLICMSVHVGVRMRTCACALASMYVRV